MLKQAYDCNVITYKKKIVYVYWVPFNKSQIYQNQVWKIMPLNMLITKATNNLIQCQAIYKHLVGDRQLLPITRSHHHHVFL